MTVIACNIACNFGLGIGVEFRTGLLHSSSSLLISNKKEKNWYPRFRLTKYIENHSFYATAIFSELMKIDFQLMKRQKLTPFYILNTGFEQQVKQKERENNSDSLRKQPTFCEVATCSLAQVST